MREHSSVSRKPRIKSDPPHPTAPVLRLRELAVGIACISLLIVWPLFMVSKQIFITNLSVRESSLSDSLSATCRRLAALRLYHEKLSNTARIESIGRERLGLEYPAPGQIVVVRESPDRAPGSGTAARFLAILRKPFSREKG